MLAFLILAAAAGFVEADQRTLRITALYEQICLEAFPDDKAVEARMAAQNAREMSPDAVKVTMGTDPARGWDLPDERASVWLEFPPFHACSIRWNAPQSNNLEKYEIVSEKYRSKIAGFHPLDAQDSDRGDIHIHATGAQRTLSDQSTEALFVIQQDINDPKRRAAGETGVVIRFVHQFAPPPGEPTK